MLRRAAEFSACGPPGCSSATKSTEEAELTDGQGRALSGHRSKAYEGYAKRTMKRALAATRKRHAHRLAANASGTEILNEERAAIQNEGSG
jgi:hypothetical protein